MFFKSWKQSRIEHEESLIQEKVLRENEIDIYLNVYIKDAMTDSQKGFNLKYLLEAAAALNKIPRGSSQSVKVGVDTVELSRDNDGKFNFKTLENDSSELNELIKQLEG